MKYTTASSKQEAQQKIGFDWAKMVKVKDGYIGFETIQEYKEWKKWTAGCVVCGASPHDVTCMAVKNGPVYCENCVEEASY